MVQFSEIGVVHADLLCFLENQEAMTYDIGEKIIIKVAQVALAVITPVIYGTLCIRELVEDISEIYNRHTAATLVKVTLVFVKTMFFATVRALASSIGLNRLAQVLDDQLARSLIELTIATSGGVQPFLCDNAPNFLRQLPDRGERLFIREDALITYIASRRRGYDVFLSSRIMRDFVTDFMYQNYSFDEQRLLEPAFEELFHRHIPDGHERALTVLCHALTVAKGGLVEDSFYDEETIATMDAEPYQAMMNRAVFEILMHSSLEDDTFRMSFEGSDEVLEISEYDDWMDSYASLKEAYLSTQNLSSEDRFQLKRLLALKDGEASDEVRTLFQKITSIRIKWDTSFMNHNDMPSAYSNRFMEIFMQSE